ncbi:metallophosphoesterase family protein [Pseudoduganella sp. R-34]|uniref:metallophosphoesterase family protein n=1 Tax=Pseudoduganella sp. R-34 TaxID=3404062 RepID=UPI003CF5DD99
MKIMHASDLHYSPTNLVEADRCFGFAVEEGIRRNVEAAIISGDSTDHRLEAHSPAFLALAKRLKQLADHCPVLLIQGTFFHEPAGMLHILGMIGAKHPIVVSDRIEMIGLQHGQWGTFDPHNTGYDLVVTCVPTVNKADLALQVGAENANEAMGEHLAVLLASFGPANDRLRAQGVPTVLVTHGTIDGSMTEAGVPMVGQDHEFTAGSLFSAGTSAVMLGHIHKHQAWERNHHNVEQRAAYPGSVGRFHYGEIGEKYFLLWDVEASTASIEPIATPSRRMIDIAFDGAPDLAQLAEVIEQCEGAYVRVRYSVDEEYAKTVDRNGIKDLLQRAAELKIEGNVLPIQRQRCAGISALPALEERFVKWAEHTQTPIEGLLDRLATLRSQDPVDIVTAFRRRLGALTAQAKDQSLPTAPKQSLASMAI